jgi:hypothetical protein
MAEAQGPSTATWIEEPNCEVSTRFLCAITLKDVLERLQMTPPNLYNPFTMQEAQSLARRRTALWVSAILMCVALFGFGTVAKMIQHWPAVNAKLQISNSCKLERHQNNLNCDRLVVAETVIILVQTMEPRTWSDPTDSQSVSVVPFARFISFRPPPQQS